MPYASNALFTSAARREGVNVSFATQLRIPMSRAAISRSLSSPSTSAMTGSFRATAPTRISPSGAVQIGYANIHHQRVEGFVFQLVKACDRLGLHSRLRLSRQWRFR